MTGFVFWASLLLLGCVGVLVFALLRGQKAELEPDEDADVHDAYTELYRDLRADFINGALTSEEFAEAEQRLARRISVEQVPPAILNPNPQSSPRWWAVGGSVMLVLLTVGMYLIVGTPMASRLLLVPGAAGDVGHGNDRLVELAQRLEARLLMPGEDSSGWILLGRTYSELGDMPRALLAFGRAVERLPDNPDALADYADALALANGRNLSGKPIELVKRALKVAPDHVKALGLAGTADFERGNFAGALHHWERALKAAPPGSAFASSLTSSIEEARGLVSRSQRQFSPQESTVSQSAPGVLAPPESISGVVSLAPSLSEAAGPDDIVFISAHPEGGGMPLAAIRTKVSMLPYRFSLSDVNSMTPGVGISSQAQIEVVARVARSRSVKRLKGDLEGRSQLVVPGRQGLAIVIDRKVE